MFAPAILVILLSCWASAYAFLICSPFLPRTLKSSSRDVTQSESKIFQYVPTGKRSRAFTFEVSTLDKLVAKVRTLGAKYKFADLELFAGGKTLDSEMAFANLPSNVPHNLRIESLSHEFSYYTRLSRCTEYLEIDEIELVSLKSFPDKRDFPNFDAERKEVAADSTRSCLWLAEDNRLETKSRDFITMMVKAAIALLHPITDEPADDDPDIPTLKMDYERTYIGRRASGKLDYLFLYTHVVVTVLEAKDMATEVLEAGVLQLGAQFRAIFDHTLRGYRKKFPFLSESEIKMMMERYPNYGMVSTGDKWALVRYCKVGEEWKLQMSAVLLMGLPLGMRPNKAQLIEQIGNILGPLAGIITAGMSDAAALEKQLVEANSAAKAASL